VHVEWTCVVDDGTRPYGPGIAVDQRRPLRLTTSEDVLIEIALVNPVGGAVVLRGNDQFLVLSARSLCAPSRPLFTARSVRAARERETIAILADSTKAMVAQRALFDLWLIRAGERTSVIPVSEMTISGNALANNYL
jgi:hypothetical protein